MYILMTTISRIYSLNIIYRTNKNMHINLPLSNKFFYYMLFLTLIITSNGSNAFSKTQANKCHPSVNTTLSQFIIGYGSLMQEASKRETDPNVGENYPIYV